MVTASAKGVDRKADIDLGGLRKRLPIHMIMRWVNAITLFASGLLYAVAGFAKIGDVLSRSRFAGAALLLGIGLVAWSIGTVVKGEVKPNKIIPRIVVNWWALVFWYSVMAIAALKYSSTVANILAPSEIGEQGGGLELALLPYFIPHFMLLCLCPLAYVWSQMYPGKPR